MMKLFNSDKKIPKETKLLIFLLFIAVIIFLHLLRSPFFIFAGIIFYKGFTASAIIYVLTALLLISIYLILQKNKLAYFANYLFIVLGINTILSLISYFILKNEVIFNIKHYYLQSFSALLSIDQIANLFLITQLMIIILYGLISYLFVKNRYYLIR
ncbi:hypothetical protein J4232_05870 [Candidatus Woesearchaeota archaeon]|nr:hypothetical protein [Candidatus Woesearchaeota archaeon]